ncbi:hypothetical protein CAC42_75 [Sphaceloma murrayae]|uniref:Uncharacterized protein n=1 Tax=Sphaceloma murrayae TaxID=2082308 RepID=A0A2K1QN70_9PEZI|nr:hypothetical protein CAC42_75 [Sphaceloma murrayae]
MAISSTKSFPQNTASTSSTSASQSSSFSTLIASSTSGREIPIITSIAASPTASSTPSPKTGTHLTSAQAVGITVGAFGGIGLAVALIFCCICLRRRKAKREDEKKKEHKKRHSYDFACATSPRTSPFQSRPEDLRGHLGGSHERRAELESLSDRSSRGVTQWLVPGGRTNPNHNRNISPASFKSDRTVSQLLPDKPETSPVVGLRSTDGKPSQRPFSTQTQGTVFEEDRTPWSPGLQKPAPIQLNFDFNRHVNTQQMSQPSHFFPPIPRRRSNHSAKSIALSLTIPKKTPLERQIAEELDTSKEVTTDPLSSSAPYPTPRSANPTQALSAGSGVSYLPSYYTSKDSRTPVIPLKSPSRPRVAQQQFRSPPPSKPLPKVPMPTRRPSRASETSFESVDPNEVTPEDELDRRLSPNNASPISGLRYPKIPRSANQAIPRSPPTSPFKRTPPSGTYPPSNTETLASKRRGTEAATEMQRRLGLADAFQPTSPPSATRQNRDSFLSYETPAKKTRPAMGGAFVTPPPRKSSVGYRERPRLSVFPNTTPTPPRGRGGGMVVERGPKLTPTKRGNEFFIDVGSP